MRIPSEVLEGSEQHELLTVGGTHKVPFPTPTIFMGKAYVFCDYLPDAAIAQPPVNLFILPIPCLCCISPVSAPYEYCDG